MYSAQPPRIQLYPIPDPLPPYIEVHRLRDGTTQGGVENIFAYANSRLGRLYDFAGVLTAGFLEIGGLEFCSQLTEDAFCEYPVCLCENIRFTSPDDIANSGALKRIS